jgi:hypothetical protein
MPVELQMDFGRIVSLDAQGEQARARAVRDRILAA